MKKVRYFSILIVPEGEGKTIHFKLRSFAFKVLVFTVMIFIAGAVLSVVFTGRIAAKLQMANYLALKNNELKEKNRKIEVLANEIEEIKKRENKIRKLSSSFMKEDVATLEKEKEAGAANNDVDQFVSQVQKKQKALELETAEGGDSYNTKLLTAVPTLRPVDGWITRGFGLKTAGGPKNSDHTGIDIAAAVGTPVMAAAPGLVTFSGVHKFYGKLLIVNHGYGYETYYGHCSRLFAKKGDMVERGQIVALVGNSGYSTAPHLHYEIKKNGSPVDPVLFFIY